MEIHTVPSLYTTLNTHSSTHSTIWMKDIADELHGRRTQWIILALGGDAMDSWRDSVLLGMRELRGKCRLQTVSLQAQKYSIPIQKSWIHQPDLRVVSKTHITEFRSVRTCEDPFWSTIRELTIFYGISPRIKFDCLPVIKRLTAVISWKSSLQSGRNQWNESSRCQG